MSTDYKAVKFTSKSSRDVNLVSVATSQLFQRPERLPQNMQFVLELKSDRQVCKVLFRVNRANGSTATTKSWPAAILRLPATGAPVSVLARIVPAGDDGVNQPELFSPLSPSNILG